MTMIGNGLPLASGRQAREVTPVDRCGTFRIGRDSNTFNAAERNRRERRYIEETQVEAASAGRVRCRALPDRRACVNSNSWTINSQLSVRGTQRRATLPSQRQPHRLCSHPRSLRPPQRPAS
jgi:hypothetical protein